MGENGTAWRGHTRWQRFIRFLFRYMGPAQTGLPIYASPDERRVYEADRASRPDSRVRAEPPPGYEVRVYTDPGGTVHRSIVRSDDPGNG